MGDDQMDLICFCYGDLMFGNPLKPISHKIKQNSVNQNVVWIVYECSNCKRKLVLSEKIDIL